ncbi:ABC transporter permease [Symbioplanes lichenis]|uniref:ABC transporter permease n=1 Tax=Symbioplanes lichenis TaxID=1629072 RepID=UPI002738931D|nr:ABC transporter permease [Actinoplanes lichenis]
MIRLAGGAALILAWWLTVVALRIESYLVPAPPAVVGAFRRHPGDLLSAAGVTLWETVQGFALAAAAGILLGTALAASDWVARAMYPALVALNAVPKLAFAPLLLVWLGFGAGPKVVLAALMAFFPIVLATATGLGTTPADLVELARSLTASRLQTFWRVRGPAALPHIFVGLKTAMPLAVIGALVGELFGATAGLGFLIQNAGADTALAFAAITLLAALSIALFSLLVAIEHRLAPWVRHTTA